MAMSRVLEGNIRDRHQAPQLPQSDTPDGLHRSRGRTSGRLPQALATVGPQWLTSDHYFEAELEWPIRLQVVAGPRNEPANPSSDVLGIRRLHVLVASPLKVTC